MTSRDNPGTRSLSPAPRSTTLSLSHGNFSPPSLQSGICWKNCCYHTATRQITPGTRVTSRVQRLPSPPFGGEHSKMRILHNLTISIVPVTPFSSLGPWQAFLGQAAISKPSFVPLFVWVFFFFLNMALCSHQ